MPTDENLNKTASRILTACIFALLLSVLIACIGIFCLNPNQDIQVHYIVQTDSLGHVTPDAKVQMDSLMWAFETHEKHIADKYEYIIEQRSNIETFLTFGGVVLSVVLAVFGFFGFKSLHDIEERLKNQIEPNVANEAKDKAKDISERLFNTYKQQSHDQLEADKNLLKTEIEEYKTLTTTSLVKQNSDEINKAVAKLRKDQKREIINVIDAKYAETIGEKMDDINSNTKTIDELQLEITKLKAQITDLKSGVRHAVYPRSNSQANSQAKEGQIVTKDIDDNPDPFNQTN